jgi:hypothetical protein
MLYVSKYVAKVADADNGLNDVPYQNNSTGRHWGMTGKCWFPWAVLIEKVFSSVLQFKSMVLLARLEYKKLRRWGQHAGFTIFTENAWQWLADFDIAADCFDEPAGDFTCIRGEYFEQWKLAF